MKHLVSFFVIILITFSFNNAKSEDLLVAYINMEKVMNETIAGKSLIQQLEKIHNKNIAEFNKTEENLKKQESSILSQKNILSEEEYKIKVNMLKDKISLYNKKRKEKIDSVAKKKIEATASLLKEINPILADYSKKKVFQ